jgi:hypothetical protein
MIASVLRWLGLLLIFPFIAIRAWRAIPGAVDRAIPWYGPAWTVGISEASVDRFRWGLRGQGLVPEQYRLHADDRWLELGDDQILPPGLYESAVQQVYLAEGWKAASIAMLRRNLAHGWCADRGERFLVAETRRRQWGHYESDKPGLWAGKVTLRSGRVFWQVIGQTPFVFGFALQTNFGWLVRDCFTVKDLVHWTARFKAPALRIKRR